MIISYFNNWLLLIVIFTNNLILAEPLCTFKDYHVIASKYNFSDTIVLTQNVFVNNLDSNIVLLLAKQFWQANELVILDSILELKATKLQRACLNYSTALAYRDFDETISDSLFVSSQVLFEELEDADGQIFSIRNKIKNN